MSWYAISAKINQQYSLKNIQKILKRGHDIGFSYSKYISGDEAEFNILNIDQATILIIEGDDDYLNRVNVKMFDSYGTLHILNDENKLTLLLNSFSYPWMKKFEDGPEEIDIIRYAKIFLNLIEDYEVLEMKITKD